MLRVDKIQHSRHFLTFRQTKKCPPLSPTLVRARLNSARKTNAETLSQRNKINFSEEKKYRSDERNCLTFIGLLMERKMLSLRPDRAGRVMSWASFSEKEYSAVRYLDGRQNLHKYTHALEPYLMCLQNGYTHWDENLNMSMPRFRPVIIRKMGLSPRLQTFCRGQRAHMILFQY